MKSEETETAHVLKDTIEENADQGKAQTAQNNANHVVPADSVDAEEVPTIPIGSLQTISNLQPAITVHSVATTTAVSLPTPLVAQPEEYRRNLGEWIQIWQEGIRPAYFPLTLMPVIVATVLTWVPSISVKTPTGHLNWMSFIAVAVTVLLLQVGAHLINDYYDYLHGVDTSNTFGPGGLIQQGMIKPTRVLKTGLVILGLGTVLGLVTAARGGAIVYLFGFIVLLLAFFFSATKHSLSSLALGELIAFFAFGPLLTIGTYLVLTGGKYNPLALTYSLPLGLLAAAIVYANDMRDAEDDAQAGKKTLATLLGLKLSKLIFVILLLLAYAIILYIGIPHKANHLLLITLWTLPTLVIAITGIIRTGAPAGYHQVMRLTLKMETAFAILFSVALLAWALIPVIPHITNQFFGK